MFHLGHYQRSLLVEEVVRLKEGSFRCWRNTEMDRMVLFFSSSLENSCSDVHGALKRISRGMRKMTVSGQPALALSNSQDWLKTADLRHSAGSLPWACHWEGNEKAPFYRVIGRTKEEQVTESCSKPPPPKISQHGEMTSRLKRRKKKKTWEGALTVVNKQPCAKGSFIRPLQWLKCHGHFSACTCHTTHASELHPILPNS